MTIVFIIFVDFLKYFTTKILTYGTSKKTTISINLIIANDNKLFWALLKPLNLASMACNAAMIKTLFYMQWSVCSHTAVI